MPAYGVSVEKQFTFRAVAELTANIYHYRITSAVAGDFDALADAVVARDKAAHTNDFTYKTVRVFGPTEGSEADNKMRLVKDLSGTGTRVAAGASLYPELCAVASIYVGRSPIKNRKVFVRKFIHALKSHTAGGIDQFSGSLSAAERTFWSTWMDSLKQVTSGAVSFDMVTPRDVLVPAGNAASTLSYARIRQLHQ